MKSPIFDIVLSWSPCGDPDLSNSTCIANTRDNQIEYWLGQGGVVYCRYQVMWWSCTIQDAITEALQDAVEEDKNDGEGSWLP
jgi:hypothetical protein